MKYDRIEGIDKDISKLVMGCDNQDHINEASELWDHWIKVGGNIFDTAFIYGHGNHEKVFGQWIKNNNNREEILIIGKGAHTPDCNPEAISKQLTISLERMNTDYVDIYIMHRDNNDYPVDEFIDVLNEDGTLNNFGLHYNGMDRFKVRTKIADELFDLNLLEKTEDYVTKVGFSERTNEIIEPKLSVQWFLKMDSISKPALDSVLNKEVNLFTKKFINTYKNWIQNIP